MLFLYQIGLFFFALAYLPFFFLKKKHGPGWPSRFGWVPDGVSRSLGGGPVYWIHAVSVGEMALAVRLAAELKAKRPGSRVLLTATTVTGSAVARRLKSADDEFLFFPIDFTFCVRRFVAAIKPKALILMETEIWPSLLEELGRRNVPVFIANARISDRAWKRYRRFRSFFGRYLRYVKVIAAQDAQMAERFVAMGAEPQAVRVAGNMKFDWRPKPGSESEVEPLRSKLARPKDFLFIAGSTHEGEEEIFFRAFKAIRRLHPEFRMVVAPRHPERFASIEKKAVQESVSIKKVSQMTSSGYDGDAERIAVLDVMGVLGPLYRLADTVFIGGSFVPQGGHNPVEPAFFGKAVLFGPSMHNFREMAAQLTQSGAAIAVSDASCLEKTILQLIDDRERRRKLGEAAQALVRAHEGATARAAQWVVEAAG